MVLLQAPHPARVAVRHLGHDRLDQRLGHSARRRRGPRRAAALAGVAVEGELADAEDGAVAERLVHPALAVGEHAQGADLLGQAVAGPLVVAAGPDGPRALSVATTRPETMLGDTAVAVHPDDPRYKSVIGKDILQPITGRRFKVVADEHADPELGTGAVKITPAHDFNDWEVGKRAKLTVTVAVSGLTTPTGVVQVLDKGKKIAQFTMALTDFAVKPLRRVIPGVFKLDYALSGPMPWTNPDCHRAGTVHCGLMAR